MLLVADAGNTNIKLAVFDADKMITTARLATDDSKTPDVYKRDVAGILGENEIDIHKIKAVAVSTVVPEATIAFLEGMRNLFETQPLVVGGDTKTGIVIKTENPEGLGADRLVNASAALHEYGGPLLVIDFGTATTYDVVTENGEFLGGIIAPGLKLCAEALWEKTAKLPEIAIEKPGRVMGTDTVSSMQSGVFYGGLGRLEYFVRQLKKDLGMDFTVVATGGLSGIFAGNTDVIDVFDPDLTLKGLRYIYKLNQ